MDFPDFHLPNDTAPFPSRSFILNYIQSYANHFNLNQHIKFNHLVIRVRPIENDRWEIIVRNLLKDKFFTTIYDAVFVCNGRSSDPRIPKFKGANEFNGKLLHSRDFRSAKRFHGEDVLIIGYGASGIDLTKILSKVAKSVTTSTKKLIVNHAEFNVTFKSPIKRFTADGVEFSDGTQKKFSTIIYATGEKIQHN